MEMTIRARELRVRRGAFAVSAAMFEAGPDGVAVIGGNGAGKSTLLLALQRLLPATGAVDVPARRAGVFAQPAVLRGSVRSNVERILASARPDLRDVPAAATRALEGAGLADLLDRDARRLSSGERQRLALARALAIEPHALFLDEAFANIDADGRPALRALVRSYVEESGCALVVATQTLADVTGLCARTVLLERGRLGEPFPTSEIARHPHPYIRALASEANGFPARAHEGR